MVLVRNSINRRRRWHRTCRAFRRNGNGSHADCSLPFFLGRNRRLSGNCHSACFGYPGFCRYFRKHDVSLEIKKASDISLQVGEEIENKPDFAIFWDKDIYLAERLEKSGVRLFNSKRAVLLCDNKILMYQALEESDIKIPKTFIAPKTFEGLNYHDRSFLKEVIDEIGFPMVPIRTRATINMINARVAIH